LQGLSSIIGANQTHARAGSRKRCGFRRGHRMSADRDINRRDLMVKTAGRARRSENYF
jgi:hypothetical protein